MSTSSSSSSLFSSSSDESENEKIFNKAKSEETYLNTISNQMNIEDISSSSESEFESNNESESDSKEQSYVIPRVQTQFSMVPPPDYVSTSNATPFTLNQSNSKNKSADSDKIKCEKCTKLFSVSYIKKHMKSCIAVSN